MPRTQSGDSKRWGVAFVFLWFAMGGTAHFVFTETEMRGVPPTIPWPRAAVLWSGLFEAAGAAGLLLRRTRRTAGIGLFILTIAVTPVHVHMLQHPELFDVPYWALLLRLGVQALPLWPILWCTIKSGAGSVWWRTAPKRDPLHHQGATESSAADAREIAGERCRCQRKLPAALSKPTWCICHRPIDTSRYSPCR